MKVKKYFFQSGNAFYLDEQKIGKRNHRINNSLSPKKLVVGKISEKDWKGQKMQV